MQQLITLILQLIEQFLLPNLSNAASIQKVIDALIQVVPLAIKEAKDVVPSIQNIIDALRGSGEVTTDQLDQLDTLEAQIDADFDAAAGN